MKELRNNVMRHLTSDEHRAILDIVDILEKTFHRKVYQVTINPDKDDQAMVFGIMVGFDMFEIKK